MTREEVLRGLERIRDVGVVNHRADMQVIDGAIEIIRLCEIIEWHPLGGKYESDSFLGEDKCRGSRKKTNSGGGTD